MTLADIIKHAQNADNRSRSVCRSLGWLNRDGSIADSATDAIKHIAHLEEQQRIDETSPLMFSAYYLEGGQ